MQKLKNHILDKLILAPVTSAELNLLLYLSHYQSQRGNVTGLYYKDACKHLKMSHQGFYDAMRGLENKQIIMIQKCSWYDWDVLILDNDFTHSEALNTGYINTGHDIFNSPDFYALKAGEKLLAMYLMKVTGAANRSYEIRTDNFYSKFTALLGIKKRILQGYLGRLKTFFSIGIKDGKYFMAPKKVAYKEKTPTDKERYADNLTKVMFRRNRAAAGAPQNVLREITDLIKQYYTDHEKAIKSAFIQAFSKSIYLRNEKRKNPYKWDRKIYPAYIHKLLRQELGIECE